MNIVRDIEVSFSEEMNALLNLQLSDFANKLAVRDQSSDYYARYRNTNQRKAGVDQLIGKKAEYVAAKGLNQFFGYPMTKPDLSIRRGSAKGWDDDLHYEEHGLPNVHVKSCSQRYNDDYSWVFQYNNAVGAGGTDKLFTTNKHDNDLIVCVQLPDSKSAVGTIKAILEWKTIKPLLKNPFLQRLIGQKLCLYYKDIEGKFNDPMPKIEERSMALAA